MSRETSPNACNRKYQSPLQIWGKVRSRSTQVSGSATWDQPVVGVWPDGRTSASGEVVPALFWAEMLSPSWKFIKITQNNVPCTRSRVCEHFRGERGPPEPSRCDIGKSDGLGSRICKIPWNPWSSSDPHPCVPDCHEILVELSRKGTKNIVCIMFLY